MACQGINWWVVWVFVVAVGTVGFEELVSVVGSGILAHVLAACLLHVFWLGLRKVIAMHSYLALHGLCA
jgi:hypothetical protein